MYRSLLLFLVPAFLLSSCTQETNRQKPNIVLIVADDLGWRDLGCYGSTFYETPNLDALAVDGMLFTNGYANCPVCSPSRASIQTGKYPVRTGVTDWIKGRKFWTGPTASDRWIVPDTEYELKLEETTVAEVLQKEGYQTFFAGKWHLGEDSLYWPENQGYEVNIGGWSKGSPQRNQKQGYNGYFAPYGNRRLAAETDDEHLPVRLTEETMAFVSAQKGQPFYVNLSYYLVHTPLQARDSLIEKYRAKRQLLGLDTTEALVRDQPWMAHATGGPGRYAERTIQSHAVYAAMVEHLDTQAGRLIDHLKAEGVYDNTLIIFTSDNGGLSTSEGSPTTNAPLRAGKGWTYEGGIRVPYLVKDVAGGLRGVRDDTPVSGVDILPTIMEVLGIDRRAFDMDGQSLTPLIQGDEMAERPIFWHYPHYGNQGGNPANAVRKGRYKLIEDLETGGYELYDLQTDIGEQHNLLDEKPVIAEELREVLDTWLSEHVIKTLEPNPDWNGGDR